LRELFEKAGKLNFYRIKALVDNARNATVSSFKGG
jgi:hypothetical protein